MGEGENQFGNLRDALEHNFELSQDLPKREDDWGDYDSPLDSVPNTEPKRHSMSETFSQTLPDYDKESEQLLSLRNYIEQTLSEGKEKHDLTGVEFGGSGSALFDGFTKNFFKKTAGVCLQDIRTEDQMDRDDQINHSVIAGDILDPSRTENNLTLKEVKKVLGTDKTDLIISRMSGPLNAGIINKHGAILDRIIRNWYGMLNQNGLIFAQFDRGGFNSDDEAVAAVTGWVEKVKEKFPELDIQTADNAMRIRKTKGSPDNLPAAKDLLQ